MQLHPICLDTDNARPFRYVQLLADLHPIKKCLKCRRTNEIDKETWRCRQKGAKSHTRVSHIMWRGGQAQQTTCENCLSVKVKENDCREHEPRISLQTPWSFVLYIGLFTTRQTFSLTQMVCWDIYAWFITSNLLFWSLFHHRCFFL